MPDHRSNLSTPRPQLLLPSDLPRAASRALWYVTKDMYSQPPTNYLILNQAATAALVADARAQCPDCVVISEDDIEATAGYRERHSKAQGLSICFNFSFGKCSGRSNGDPATCHQIHVKQDTLNRLREGYVHPRRTFMSRTVKALIAWELKAVLSRMTCGKSDSMMYFEFLTTDVHETAGRHTYEHKYRCWLQNDSASLSSSASPERNSARTTPAPFCCSGMELCAQFCLTQQCVYGPACSKIHPNLGSAMTRDPTISDALKQLQSMPLSMPSQAAPRVLRPTGLCLRSFLAQGFSRGEITSPCGGSFTFDLAVLLQKVAAGDNTSHVT